MITTSTYRDRVEPRRDVLAAYSALDHATTAELTDAQIDAAFARLLTRLSVLLFLHGPTIPGRFLESLSACDDRDPVDVVAAFLETGGSHADQGSVSELQQELVHFSRIVDLGDVGLTPEDQQSRRTLRRLRNSSALPSELKVLSELIIVARSRMLARGSDLPLPVLRGRVADGEDLTNVTSLWRADDHALLVTSTRRRTRKEAGFLFNALLCYLTPGEASLAVWAHATQSELRDSLGMVLLSAGRDGEIGEISWCLPPGGNHRGGADPIAWCLDQLPVLASVGLRRDARRELHDGDTLDVGYAPDGHVGITITTGEDQVERTLTLRAISSATTAAVGPMAEQVEGLLGTYDGPDVISIEFGHIHLDRGLDVDQETGVLLGRRALETLTGQQARPPVTTPMMDDDHVLVTLRPMEYRAFLERHVGAGKMHLIVESSPIIRAVVTALWVRLHRLGLASRIRERGPNLFLGLGENGEFCELFKDFQHGDLPGTTITGCVFFESALLVYRSAPARFDAYFRDRFALQSDLHDVAGNILGADGGHDERQAHLSEFYARFRDMTDPRRPDPQFLALVDEVIDGLGEEVAHLNVLEDYYEIQQGKVRALVKLLELPIRLISVHFNARTGRVVLDG